MTGRPWESAVLEIIARSGQIKLAAECAGVTRQVVYYHLRRNPRFAAAVDSAKATKGSADTRSAIARFQRAV